MADVTDPQKLYLLLLGGGLLVERHALIGLVIFRLHYYLITRWWIIGGETRPAWPTSFGTTLWQT